MFKLVLCESVPRLMCVPQRYVLLLFWSHSVCILAHLSVFLYERQFQTIFKVLWQAYLTVMVMPKLLWFWSSIARDRQKAALHNELVCIHDTRSDCVRIMATCGDDISPSDAKKICFSKAQIHLREVRSLSKLPICIPHFTVLFTFTTPASKVRVPDMSNTIGWGIGIGWYWGVTENWYWYQTHRLSSPLYY